MTNRTPHPEQPAEGSDKPAYTEDTDSEEQSTSGDDAGDDILSAMPGRLNQDLDDPSKSDPGLSPDSAVGSA